MSSIRWSTPSTGFSISGSGAAVIGAVDDVVTGPVLSRLYGTRIEVIRARDRYFVMAADGGVDVEREAHRHDHHAHDAHA